MIDFMSSIFCKYSKFLNIYKKELLLSWVAVVLVMVCSAISMVYRVHSKHINVNRVWDSMGSHMTTIIQGHVFIDTLMTNVLISIIILCISCLPVPFLYILPVVPTFLSIGQLLGLVFYKYGLIKTIKLVVLTVMPHGIIEITAIIVTLIVAKEINKHSICMIKDVLRKRPVNFNYNFTVLTHSLTNFISITLPLLFVASLIETFVVPILFKLI